MLTLTRIENKQNKLYTPWKWFFIGLLLLLSSRSQAQKFGGNTPRTQWMQLHSDSLRILFPKGYQKEAETAFLTAQYMLQNERAPIGSLSQKLNIILQPYTALSNGFVSLAPFRSVFFTTPSQDNFSLGTTHWIKQLGIHETWHALQYMNFKTGIGKTFHTLFGDMGASFIDTYLIPDWYWEGEAVFMETQLTDQGRGRLPSFFDPYKALWLSDKRYNYSKIRNGSLKDIVPNKYQSGYMTVAYGRNKYGNDFWHAVIQETLLNRKFIKNQNKQNPKNPFHLFKYGFYPLDAALNYHTGQNIKHFYKSAILHFKKDFEKTQAGNHFTPVNNFFPNSDKKVLHYRYPTFMNDHQVLALKYGYAVLPRIVLIDSLKEEKTLVHLGRNTQQHNFSFGGNKLVWTEYRPDIRWGWKNYSVIQSYDMKTGKTKTLTHKSKYFAPALSSNGKKIVAVKTVGDISKLVILDATNGEPLKSLSNPNHYFYTHPVFDLDDTYIITGARDSLSNMALIKINIQNGKQKTLTPFAPKAIGKPNIQKHWIYFPAGYKDNIQIYVVSRKSRKIFRVTNRPLSDYSVAVNPKTKEVLLNEYSLKGFKIRATKKDTATWQPINYATIKNINNPYVPEALRYFENHSILKKIRPKKIPVEKYHPSKHLFRIHSWSFETLYPETSFFLRSRDLLGKMQAIAGGGYNYNEETPFLQIGFNYGGLFPILKAGITETFQRSGLNKDSSHIFWNETNWYLGFQIPLDLSGGLFHRKLSFSGTFHQGILAFNSTFLQKIENKTINYYKLSLSFNNLRNKTVQAIKPKLGFSFSTNYYHSIETNPINKFNTNINLFLPGIAPNHSLYFTSSFSERNNIGIYKFEDNFHYANGYHSIPYKDIYTVGANYQFPLCYPDFGLAWAYLLRVRLHLFFDYSQAKMPAIFKKTDWTFRSVGATLYFDTQFFQHLSIPIGIRYAKLLDTDMLHPRKGYQFSFILPLTLF